MTNPLSNGNQQRPPARSAFRALEWAQLAHDKGRTATAKMWEDAHKEGWDERNWCPLKAEEFRNAVRDAQRGWA